MRISEDILRKRIKKFQDKFREQGLDGVMLRTLSSYSYFTGIKWLRPGLFIPSEGEPIAFISRGEEQGFAERTWIKNVITYKDGGDLIGKVTRTLREFKIKNIGMEFGVERDSYILFYIMFQRFNPGIKITDVGPILAELRMIKDKYELENIRIAGKKASKAMAKALNLIKPGVTETEIAADIYSELYRLGSEDPKVYVNAGPHPRVHAEPFRDSLVKENTFVTVVIAADHNGYYTNMSRTIFVGQNMSSEVKKIIDCTEEVYEKAKELTKPGIKFMKVIQELDKIYDKHGLKDKRVIGYVHGVGLQIEETPITTIVPKHRLIEVKPNMVLAFIHSPIMYDGLGQMKKEDTFIVKEDSTLEQVTF